MERSGIIPGRVDIRSRDLPLLFLSLAKISLNLYNISVELIYKNEISNYLRVFFTSLLR